MRVFVFGSNRRGAHGKGAALEAVRNWGATHGMGHGLQLGTGSKGRSYAIPTKDSKLRPLCLDVIEIHVHTFLQDARSQPHFTFLVTRVGCGLAGYKDEQIAPFFFGAPENCEFDPAWDCWGLKSWKEKP